MPSLILTRSTQSPLTAIWQQSLDHPILTARLRASSIRIPSSLILTSSRWASPASAYLAAYRTYLTTILSEAGYENVGTVADDVIALETHIAAEHWDRGVGRNRNLTYNKISRDELVAMAGEFPVIDMLKAIGVDGETSLLAGQILPTAEEIAEYDLSDEQLAKLGGGIPALFTVAAETDLNTWKAYLTVHFLGDNAAVLPAAFDNARFEMFAKTLRGAQEQRERWKRAVGAVEGALGEGVGKVYAARHFPAENKAAMDELVENLRKAMGANLDDITWMGEATKVEARDKLAKFDPKIGFTEKFETYDTLTISADNALGNARAVTEWNRNGSCSRKPSTPITTRSIMRSFSRPVSSSHLSSTSQLTQPSITARLAA